MPFGLGDMVDSAPRHVRHLETWCATYPAELHPDVVEHCVSARNVCCRKRPPLAGRRLSTPPNAVAFDGLGALGAWIATAAAVIIASARSLRKFAQSSLIDPGSESGLTR